MTLEQIEQERKRFEACEVARDLDLTRQVNGDEYLYYPTSVCWLAWLARAQEEDKPDGWPWNDFTVLSVIHALRDTADTAQFGLKQSPTADALRAIARWLDQSPEQGGQG